MPIETMCQRPRNGDLDLGFFFAMVSPSDSTIVAEPVAVIPDQLAVARAGLVEFGQRHVERSLTSPGLAEQSFFLVQVVLIGVGKSMDGHGHAALLGPRLE